MSSVFFAMAGALVLGQVIAPEWEPWAWPLVYYCLGAAIINALWDISSAMGLESPWQIQPHHLHERLNSARSDSIDRIYKFYDRGVLLDDPDSVSSARYWAMARANSFRAAL